jgi:hypothetical protein
MRNGNDYRTILIKHEVNLVIINLQVLKNQVTTHQGNLLDLSTIGLIYFPINPSKLRMVMTDQSLPKLGNPT